MRRVINFVTVIMVGLVLSFSSCSGGYKKEAQAPQWQEITIELTSEAEYMNPYTDVEVYAVFKHVDFGQIRRPAFWDGGNSWKIRFASPVDAGTWHWETISTDQDNLGLHNQQGELVATTYTGNNELIKKGLLRMSPGRRNVVHADGTPFLVVGDTPWALPWRATTNDAEVYAKDRSSKGFNAALLMSFCPDREAEGPDARATVEGFARAFDDIRDGHFNQIRVEYFQYFDSIVNILLNNGIVPVYQPVFQGFGWKGLQVLGWDLVPEEYERYMKYLIARYGAQPAIWLYCGDSDCREAGVAEAGSITELWDDYKQPAGQHYSPFDEIVPDWWNRGYEYVPHMNRVNHDQDFLDFQWCQTGHGGEHLFHKVEKMYDNSPVKATANGEPTYEGIRDPANGTGWWQGHEAWSNLMQGGTMGIVYGAGGLWNWKVAADEPGWPDWANSNVSWREAIDLPGSTFAGRVGLALNGYDVVDMERKISSQNIYYLAKEGKTFIAYLPEGGEITIDEMPDGLSYTWYDPTTGQILTSANSTAGSNVFLSPQETPVVLIAGEKVF